jgi:hypothetical protein
MFKTLALCFTSIVALAANRGAGTGLDAENSVEIVLIPDKLSLFTFNSYQEFIDKWHGILVWTGTKPGASVVEADTYY